MGSAAQLWSENMDCWEAQVSVKSSRLLVQTILAACNNCFPDNVALICKCHIGDKEKHFNVTEKFDLGANYFNLREFLAHLHT